MKKLTMKPGVGGSQQLLPSQKITYAKPRIAPGVIPWDADFSRVVERINSDRLDASDKSTSFQRIYDEGMHSWLYGLCKPDGKRVPVIMSSPKTAFGDYKIALSNPDLALDAGMGQRFAQLNAGLPRQFPLPFISFTRGDVSPRPSQRNQWPVRCVGFIDDKPGGSGTSRRSIAYTKWPQPLYIKYQANIWALTRPEHDLFQARVLEQFTNTQASVWVRNPYEGGKHVYCAMHLENMDDMTEYEGDSSKECLFRLSVNWKIEAWQFFDMLAAPAVLSQSMPILVMGSDGSYKQLDEILTQYLVSYAPVAVAPTASPVGAGVDAEGPEPGPSPPDPGPDGWQLDLPNNRIIVTSGGLVTYAPLYPSPPSGTSPYFIVDGTTYYMDTYYTPPT
jgi:hypothetical protein